jgi:hypothetical protein
MQGFAGLAERYDLDFFPLPGDAQTLVQTTATAGGLSRQAEHPAPVGRDSQLLRRFGACLGGELLC